MNGENKLRALIVDDSRFLRERLKQMLRATGWECTEAEDGIEAFGLLANDSAFDLMLLDVNMPRMDGLECVRRLRAQDCAPSMKVMMVTTEVDSGFIEKALKYGADEFLMKPMTSENLRSKLLLLGLAGRLQHAMRA
jgi:two-component system chemotaxis response regulator CheY